MQVIYNPKDNGEINEQSVILQSPFKQEISNKPIQNFPIDGKGIYRDGKPFSRQIFMTSQLLH